MNVSRVFVATATTISVLAAIGCTATQRAPEVAAAPQPVQVAANDAMPSHPALQNERTAETAVPYEAPAPAYVAQEPAMTQPITEFTERPPQADRN